MKSLLWTLSVLLVLPLPAAAEKVSFASLDGTTTLSAYLSVPRAQGPHPAVVMLHGCGGLGRDGGVSPRHLGWAGHLMRAGYAVLLLDSAGPRGFGATCGPGPERKVMWRDRPKDAYATLAFLQSRVGIDPARIALMGWSQGGGVVLLSINSRSIGRPVTISGPDFAAAVALYPGACSERLQTRPFTDVPSGGWETAIPLLVLHGDADDWTPAGPCRDFIAAARARGQPVDMKIYPGALHGFDAPNLAPRRLEHITLRGGGSPTIGTDKAARADALRAVPDFFARYLSPAR